MPRADRLRLNATPGVFNPSAQPDLLSAPQPSPEADTAGHDGPWPGDIDRFGTYAYYSAGSGRLGEALALTEHFAQHSDTLEPLLGHIHEGRGYVLSWLGRPAECEQEYKLAHSQLRLDTQYVQLFLVLISELEALYWPYQPQLLSGTRSPLEHAEHVGRLAGAAFPDDCPYQVYLLPTYYRLGRWDEIDVVTARADIAGTQHFIRQKVTASLGWLAHWRGDPSAAWRQFHTLLPRGAYTQPGDDSLPGVLDALRLATTLHLAAGNADEAQRALEAQDRWLAWSGTHVRRAEAELDWAHWERTHGALDRAESRARSAHDNAAQPEQPLVLAATLQLLGELAAGRGDAAEARRQLAAAEDLLRRCPCPFELARCRLARAEVEVELGDAALASTLAEAARDCFISLRAEPLLKRATALLDTLAAGSKPTPSAFAALTARELDVLRFVAKGMTDAEVAQQLYISPRTVGAHMRSIFNKLNVNSRAAAARIAGEQRLV
jgi:DNA-binding CsgD family transcriptional regulator